MGQFKPGDPRPPNAGRRPGSVNKKTQALIDKCEEMGLDPFQGLLELSKDEDKNIRLAALKEVCSYLYPKRRPAEGPEDSKDKPQESKTSEMVKEFKQAVISHIGERKSS